MRDVVVSGDAVIVDGDEVGVPWADVPKRLPELAVARVLAALGKPEGFDKLWSWARPLQDIEMNLRLAKEEAEEK